MDHLKQKKNKIREMMGNRDLHLYSGKQRMGSLHELCEDLLVCIEALEFYSDDGDYEPRGNPYDWEGDDIPGRVVEDKGDIARTALTKLSQPIK